MGEQLHAARTYSLASTLCLADSSLDSSCSLSGRVLTRPFCSWRADYRSSSHWIDENAQHQRSRVPGSTILEAMGAFSPPIVEPNVQNSRESKTADHRSATRSTESQSDATFTVGKVSFLELPSQVQSGSTTDGTIPVWVLPRISRERQKPRSAPKPI